MKSFISIFIKYYYLLRRHVRLLVFSKWKEIKPVLKVQLGVTYACQCKCTYCGTSFYKQDRDEMSLSQIKKVIREIADTPYVIIFISFFGGEPLLRKDLFELIRFTRELGVFCEIDTNGLLLTEETIGHLKDVGLHHVYISLDNADEIKNDEIKGIKGTYQQVIRAIKLCLTIGLPCSISTCTSKSNVNAGYVKEIVDLGKHLGVSSVRFLPPADVRKWKECDTVDNPSDLLGCEELTATEVTTLKNLLIPKFVYLEMTKVDRQTRSKECPCIDQGFFYISPYGDVQPCPYVPISFGNVLEEALAPILTSMWSELRQTCKGRSISCLTNDSVARDRFSAINLLND